LGGAKPANIPRPTTDALSAHCQQTAKALLRERVDQFRTDWVIHEHKTIGIVAVACFAN
jgi:hypothetical protein